MDLFDGYSIEETLRTIELFVMAVMVMISVPAVGAASEPARVPSRAEIDPGY